MNEYNMLCDKIARMPLDELIEALEGYGHSRISALEWITSKMYVIDDIVHTRYSIFTLWELRRFTIHCRGFTKCSHLFRSDRKSGY